LIKFKQQLYENSRCTYFSILLKILGIGLIFKKNATLFRLDLDGTVTVLQPELVDVLQKLK